MKPHVRASFFLMLLGLHFLMGAHFWLEIFDELQFV